MKKSLIIKQTNINDCAVCCLASIIKYYGGNYNLEKLRELMHTTRSGTTAYNIIDCASTLGFMSKGIKIDEINKLNDIPIPFIAHVVVNKSYMHYVVIYKINNKNKTMKIMDPAKGTIKIKFDEFDKMWTNIVLTFQPIRKIISLSKNNSFIKIIKNIILNFKSILIICIVLSLLSYILGIIKSLQLKFIIENSYSHINYYVNVIFLMFILSIIFKFVFDYLKNSLIIYLNNKIEFNITINTFSHIIKLPYDYFRTKTSGDIISRINDLNSIKDNLLNFIIGIATNLLIFIISVIILYNLSSTLFTFTFIIILILLCISLIFSNLIKTYINKVYKYNSYQATYLLESINSFESIKSMNNHGLIIHKYENKLIDYLNSKINFQNMINKDNSIKEFIYSISSFVILFIGYKKLLNNNMSLGNLILYSTIYNYFIQSIKELISMIPAIQLFNKTVNRINDIFEIDSEKFLTYKNDNSIIKGDIVLENVCYTINNMYKILENVNLKIKYGSKIAIIGSTGSGKSTFLKIILRYYKFDSGKIYIEKRNILDYDILHLRKSVCYVSQNEFLFTDSIYNNIVMNRNINYEYFLKICNICEVDKIVENKSLRYDYPLEENGFNISGGEKARIILARTLLNTGNIYIFDEALKELDSASERRILKKVFDEFKNKTFLVVTHKLDNLILFDNILYVNNKNINYVTDL